LGFISLPFWPRKTRAISAAFSAKSRAIRLFICDPSTEGIIIEEEIKKYLKISRRLRTLANARLQRDCASLIKIFIKYFIATFAL
jgi:hypothetical protein